MKEKTHPQNIDLVDKVVKSLMCTLRASLEAERTGKVRPLKHKITTLIIEVQDAKMYQNVPNEEVDGTVHIELMFEGATSRKVTYTFKELNKDLESEQGPVIAPSNIKTSVSLEKVVSENVSVDLSKNEDKIIVSPVEIKNPSDNDKIS